MVPQCPNKGAYISPNCHNLPRHYPAVLPLRSLYITRGAHYRHRGVPTWPCTVEASQIQGQACTFSTMLGKLDHQNMEFKDCIFWLIIFVKLFAKAWQKKIIKSAISGLQKKVKNTAHINVCPSLLVLSPSDMFSLLSSIACVPRITYSILCWIS